MNEMTDGEFPYIEMVEALAAHDTEFLKTYASDPECPAGLFGLLCEESLEVQVALASNPNLNDPYISHLIVVGGEDLISALLGNPMLEAVHLRMILERNPRMMFPVLEHPNTPTDLLEYVYHRECDHGNGQGETVATAIISHRNVPVSILIPAYRDFPSLQDEVVEAFVQSGTHPGISHAEMRELLNSHPETSPRGVKIL